MCSWWAWPIRFRPSCIALGICASLGATTMMVPLTARSAPPTRFYVSDIPGAPYVAPVKYDSERTLCFDNSANKLVAKWWAGAGGRPPKITSQVTVMPKDDAGRGREAVNSIFNDFGAGDLGALDDGTKSKIDAIIDGYPETRIGFSALDMRRLPVETQQIIESIIHECVSDFVSLPASQQDLARSEALIAEHVENWKRAKVYFARKQEIDSKRQAEDQANLKHEEDAALGKWRDCLAANVTGLALVSTEPAVIIVRAAYAACRQQREAVEQIYNRQHGDPGAGDRIMNEIERSVLNHFILIAIQARAAHDKPAPAPTSQPVQKENPI